MLYRACWSRALPSDFRVRTLDGVADDWPITYEELEPFYDQVELEMGVSGLAGNPVYPPGYKPPLPPFPINKTGRMAAEALNSPSVTAVSVDGGKNTPGSDADVEVMLDIEVVGAVANGAKIAVYFAPNTDKGFVDAITDAVHDTTRKPSVISEREKPLVEI